MGQKTEENLSTREVREKVVKTALDLAAETGWDSVTLYDIADKSNISIAKLFDLFDDRHDILAAFGKYVDHRVMHAVTSPGSDLSTRDRVFDLIMERLDVLNEHRDGVMSILRSFSSDPKEVLMTMPHLGRSMSWILEASGEPTRGISGCVKVVALTAVYLKTIRVWMKDDTVDMAKTMAALDKNLGRLESLWTQFGKGTS